MDRIRELDVPDAGNRALGARPAEERERLKASTR
jgi:hypothetical protein